MKWEYKIAMLPIGDKPWPERTWDEERSSMGTGLDVWGADGWELVTVMLVGTVGFVAFFKRPLA